MSNNSIILEGCIHQFKQTNEITLRDSEIFEVFALTQITKHYNLSYENIIASIVDGSCDGGIDSVIVLVNDQYIENEDELSDLNFTNKTTSRFIISQCKKENSFKETALDKLITTTPELFDLSKNENDLLVRFNSELVNQILLLRNVWQKTIFNGGKIFVDFVYCCIATEVSINAAFISKIEQLKSIASQTFYTQDVTFSNFSSAELLKFYQIQYNSRISIEFKEQPLSTNYNDFGIGYLGIVKLSEYKRFLTSEKNEIRDELFESNIRHFQGAVDVNNKIKSSIQLKGDDDFWWLNNGITLIAEESSQIGKKLSMENVQIVNGLQTSFSIYNNFQNNPSDERSVLVKVIVNKNKETIDNIIASTNSQSPVSPTLLRATDEIQRNLELFFLNSGYYYDRRKNYYKNQGKPSSKVFSIQTAAQSINAILYKSPHTSRARPTSLLKEERSYQSIFDPSKDFKAYLNCCLIFKKTNELWLNINSIEQKNNTANFKIHLAFLIPRIIKGIKNITIHDISNFEIESINEVNFNKTLQFLLDSLKSYQESNPGKNLINMAKSSEFTTYLINNL